MTAVTAGRIEQGKVPQAMGIGQKSQGGEYPRRPLRLRASPPLHETLVESFEGSVDRYEDNEADVYFDEGGKPVAYRMPAERLKKAKIDEGDRFLVKVFNRAGQIRTEVYPIEEAELFPDPPDSELLDPEEQRDRYASPWDKW